MDRTTFQAYNKADIQLAYRTPLTKPVLGCKLIVIHDEQCQTPNDQPNNEKHILDVW